MKSVLVDCVECEQNRWTAKRLYYDNQNNGNVTMECSFLLFYFYNKQYFLAPACRPVIPLSRHHLRKLGRKCIF